VGDRSIVLDANILVRAALGVRVRQLIERYAPEVDLFAPDVAFVEAEAYLPRLYAKRGLSAQPAMEVYERVSAIVQELPLPFYLVQESDARVRIERRDAQDWPVLACTLVLKCPVWTEDLDFFGSGVATWTSDRVELFLSKTTG
jgi:predicted nucleic acid-binding protein